jgi:hypothetical protein
MENQISPHNSYREEVIEGLDLLWEVAVQVVCRILSFQPDVVVALLHSGWAPAKAARMLWQATQAEAFPPLVKTNLGREKISFYPGGSKKISAGNFLGDYSDPFQIGHFLAWLVHQKKWLAVLAGQIQAQLPAAETPQRIMIVDDWIAEGNTWILSLGLLDILYPQAEKQFVAGASSWKKSFHRLWLESFHPHLLQQLNSSPGRDGSVVENRHVLINHLIRLIPGTEDVDAASFDWQPITASSPDIQKLTKYLPAKEWLELPRFVDKMIEDYIGSRIREYQRGMLDELVIPGTAAKGTYPRLRLESLVLRDLWLEECSISRRAIVEKYNLSSEQASRLLKKMLRSGLLIRKGHGRGAFYCLHPDAYPSTTSA